MSNRRLSLFALTLAIPACGDSKSDNTTNQTGATTISTSGGEDSTGGADEGMSTTGAADSSGGPTEETGADGGSTGNMTGVGFIMEPDGGGAMLECDPYAQDCPAGEQCMPWAHDGGREIVNTLYGRGGVVRADTWTRLPGSYHGSGCTLASAIAAMLANGLEIPEAVREAQDYTWHALKKAYRPGMGQFLPDRLFWARESGEEEADGDGRERYGLDEETRCRGDDRCHGAGAPAPVHSTHRILPTPIAQCVIFATILAAPCAAAASGCRSPSCC